MRVYLAARYSRMHELENYASELRDYGIETTSRWITGRHETPPDGVAVDSPEHLAWAADEDLADLDDASVLIAFTEPEGAIYGRGRGGRHVEMGYALGTNKRIVVCGHRENVFCFLPEVWFARDWSAVKQFLLSEIGRAHV